MNSKLLIVLGMIFSGTTILAQSDSITDIKFSYDNAGNRISREIIYFESQQKSALVSVEEELEFSNGLNIYPNPASNSVFVVLNQDALEEQERIIYVYDNLGKEILQHPAHSQVNQIDVSRLLEGTYIFKLVFGPHHKEWIIIKN